MDNEKYIADTHQRTGVMLAPDDAEYCASFWSGRTHQEATANLVQLFTNSEITDDALTVLLPKVWKSKADDCQVPVETWRAMFAKIPYTVNAEVSPRPRRRLRLFRGATPEHRYGLSWTRDKKQATYFANHRQDPRRRDATVWVCDVPPDRFLADLGKRSMESEIVCDVRGLDIRELGAEERPSVLRRLVRRLR